MTTLPITHMTLYKHGVGFFERRATISGEEVALSFRVEEMNDILKSLTAVDWSDGQVLGIDYATPQSRHEQLAGCSIALDDRRSLRDLLISLRGRAVKLQLDQDETAVGTLIGLDETDPNRPMAKSLVTVLTGGAETAETAVYPLKRVRGVDILDERGAADLRFFLQVSLAQENYRQVTVRLTPGTHDLSVSYIAPAPTWRVSYRFVTIGNDGDDGDGGKRGLLQGWGIFDNRLEEELKNISLSLTAGMPISFIYDLYTPFTPERPKIKEESRTVAAPVNFDAAPIDEAVPMMRAMAAPASPAPMAKQRRGRKMSAAAMEKSTAVDTTSSDLGELFQYNIATPVTVGRGQSAMVPILSTTLPYRKELLYNGRKHPNNPIATLRLDNKTSLTLERGPVTVIDDGEYVGEAVLPFTGDGAEFNIPYAVELGVMVREENGSRRELHGVNFKDSYLMIEEWMVEWVTYRVENKTAALLTILLEQPRRSGYDLFDSAKPAEITGDQYRFEVDAAAKAETTLTVKSRRRISRREEIRNQNYATIGRYLQNGMLDRAAHDKIVELLRLWQKIADHQKRLGKITAERKQIYTAQTQIQGNMKALGSSGKEGGLRAQYVDKLAATEKDLQTLAGEESRLQAEIKKVEATIARKLK